MPLYALHLNAVRLSAWIILSTNTDLIPWNDVRRCYTGSSRIFNNHFNSVRCLSILRFFVLAWWSSFRVNDVDGHLIVSYTIFHVWSVSIFQRCAENELLVYNSCLLQWSLVSSAILCCTQVATTDLLSSRLTLWYNVYINSSRQIWYICLLLALVAYRMSTDKVRVMHM